MPAIAGPSPSGQLSIPALSTPEGGGAIRGLGESFSSQSFSGAAGFSLPIPAPSARGISPNLSLTYSSGGGNGVFGLGARVALSSIARKTSAGVPRYSGKDTFVLADEGDLVAIQSRNKSNGEWAADRRIEHCDGIAFDVASYQLRQEGEFASVERWTRSDSGKSHWQILTRDNVLHTYGRTAAARIFDPAAPSRVFQWLIDETRDSRGNRIVYSYKPEDEVNVSAAYETGRDHSTNRYIWQIAYGNYLVDGNEHFAIRIAFDYGGFSSDKPDAPSVDWPVRPDPFSSYRSGFEIRTLRRCANILVYHCFHDQFGGQPVLTKSLSLTYEQANALSPPGQPAPTMSLIAAISETGWRKQADGAYLARSSPPVTFKYSGFHPADQSFRQLAIEGQGLLAGYLTAGQYLPVDLEGEGLSGILYSDGSTALQWEPLGDGRYAGPTRPIQFPSDLDLGDADVAITSLTGNGELDLVVRAPSRHGFYGYAGNGLWQQFRPFSSVPTDLARPDAELVDIDGDGAADLLVFDNDLIRSYPSLGPEGYGPPDVVGTPPDFPAPREAGLQELATFADLFGDGLSHRVRIRDGSVECWPSLGYGRFGAKIVLANAPIFGAAFDARRLFLVDVAGAGAADLVYACPDHIRIYFNEDGNRFSDPLIIRLPAPYHDPSQISFADILGNGTSCLILSSLTPGVIHRFYDFAGDLKPYLLTSIDNNLGSVTRISYSTSVKQYLADKRAGRNWATRLFFPVQVVDTVESNDAITGSRHVTRHRYHDGYYDPVEREFRGFGFVETWDTDEYESSLAAAKASPIPVTTFSQDLYVPPVYTRTWRHTGAFGEDGAISRQYAEEYWNGDPQALQLPDSALAPEIHGEDAETVRQAYVALAGLILRQEAYGQDGSPLAANPFTVSETRAAVRLLQPRGEQLYAVFLTLTAESLTYEYDRNPADPRIQHVFNLEVDAFGNVERRCTVAYPRRQSTELPIYPEQLLLRTVVSKDSFINHVETAIEPYRWIGQKYDGCAFELEGLTCSGYFCFDDLSAQVCDAMQNPLDYGEPFTQGRRQARLFSWERTAYWNADLTAPLDFKTIGPQGLLHHTEVAALTPRLVQSALAARLSPDQIASGAGYWLDQGYWWNRRLIQYYLPGNGQFFLRYRTAGDFRGVDPESHLNPTTEITYDAYCLLPIQSIHYLQGGSTPVALTVKAENDYQALSPTRITDPNGNVSEALFDPLGRVIVTSTFGTDASGPVGDDPLTAYHLISDATFTDVIGDPAKYLQNATSFFFYDLMAWSDRQEPLSAVGLHRQIFIHDLKPGETSPIEIKVVYSDGFSRIIGKKVKANAGPVTLRNAAGVVVLDDSGTPREIKAEDRWIASGRIVYNNKGLPALTYQPFYSLTPAYDTPAESTQQGLVPPPTALHYDAIGRLVRTDTPKGFFSKVDFAPWQTVTYDEDDTVKDSSYYKNFPVNPTTPAEKNERDALDKAAAFYHTPSTSVLDTLGRTVRSIQNNLGAVRASDFEGIVAGSGTTAQQLFDQLISFGYLAVDSGDSSVAWATGRVQPYAMAFQQNFVMQFAALAAPTLTILKTNGLTTLHELDIVGRAVSSTDPRLLYSNVTEATDYYNVRSVYGLTGPALAVDSADAGCNSSLHDIFANLYWSFSARNFEQIVTYDRLLRRLTVRAKGFDDGGTAVSDKLVEVYTYGETPPQAEQFNLRGQLYQLRDQSGLVTCAAYDMLGHLLHTSRQLTTDYQTAIDWGANVPLEADIYPTQFAYDARRQLVSETSPDGVVTRKTYDLVGRLTAISVVFADGAAQPIIQDISYDANSQKLTVQHANGVTTTRTYEETTLRVIGLQSTRSRTGGGATALQDVTYTYDPVGNLTRRFDATYQTVFHNNQKVEPLCDYAYDAFYRLVLAGGRQNPAVTAAAYRNNSADGDFKESRFCPLPGDGNALENYREHYRYDDGGNLISTRHIATNGWTRTQEVMPNSNRLKSIASSNGVAYSYPMSYDNAGNQRQLHINSAVALTWNCCDNLVSAGIISRPSQPDDSDYYTYDSKEMRTRKVSERMAGGGAVVQTETRIYLGQYEIKLVKKITEAGETSVLKRRTLRVMDGDLCVAIIHSWDQDEASREVDAAGTHSLRYQMDDGLGSAALEISGDAEIISYEEYFPYGGTAFIAGPNQQEVCWKHYRYSGKERDNSTGLYYFGARYYAPWLGRWLKPDPAGSVDGLNLYAFVRGNPLRLFDPTGLSAKSQAKKAKKATTSSSNNYEWDVTAITSHVVADPDVQSVLSRFGHPTSSVVKTYDDLASRVRFDVGHSRTGKLSHTTVDDLEKSFEASTPLHFNFNSFLRDAWTGNLNSYSGSKSKIPLYSVMRSKATAEFQYQQVGSVSLNDVLWEVSSRPAEVHHILFKAIHPGLANQVTNLMLTERSERESVYGPGQHELMHMVASGYHSDKFNKLLPQYTAVYENWILSKTGDTDMVVSDRI